MFISIFGSTEIGEASGVRGEGGIFQKRRRGRRGSMGGIRGRGRGSWRIVKL